MRLVAVLVLAVFGSVAGPVAADPKPAKPAPACKKVIVGKGKDRKAICEYTAEIVVTTSAPKPKVVYVTRGGKDVTGRPQSEDRLKGMGPQTK